VIIFWVFNAKIQVLGIPMKSISIPL